VRPERIPRTSRRDQPVDKPITAARSPHPDARDHVASAGSTTTRDHSHKQASPARTFDPRGGGCPQSALPDGYSLWHVLHAWKSFR
jgi:hypothetical protein